MDMRDLRTSTLPQATVGLSTSATDGAVRIATIDNYQGEEADVVVASLVRSNSSGKTGFLREPERINVLMSRARHGCIFIGNTSCFRKASDPSARRHWGAVLDLLEQRGQIYQGLPAVCQQHGRRTEPLLDSPEAFKARCPDGGCKEPCNALLPCQHACPLWCHAYDPEHKRVQCKELVYGSCDRGHLTMRKCSDAAAVCPTCVEIRVLQEREKKELEQLVSGGFEDIRHLW